MDTTTPRVDTLIRTFVLTIALLNQLLTAFGINPLPFDDEQIATIVTVFVSLWAWWKNNSFTSAAIKADQVRKENMNDETN